MKSRILLFVFVCSIAQASFAQVKQADTSVYYKSLIPTDKQSRLSNFEIIANQQFAFRSDYTDGKYQDSRYKYEQFRLEMRGWVSEKVFFRFRHRYTSEFVPQSQDKIIKGVDMAYMNFKLGNSNKW